MLRITLKYSSPLLIAAASLVTFAAAQSLTPTAHAQTVSQPLYQVRLDWQKAEEGLGGLVIRGRVTNTGKTPLTYTQVTPTLIDRTGKEVFRGNGYLTVSPLLPGQSAEFRACEPAAPRFAGMRMVFREAGHPILVEQMNLSASRQMSGQAPKTASAL